MTMILERSPILLLFGISSFVTTYCSSISQYSRRKLLCLDMSFDTERITGGSSINDESARTSFDPVAALQFARMAGRLKVTPRTGWVRRGVPRYESVADHSWRVAVLSLLLCPSQEVNMDRVMAVALVHDLAESIAGDITPDDNVSDEDKAKLEDDAMKQIARMLRKATSSEDAAHHLLELFHEYEDRKTNEGKAVKDLDLLDMIIQADEYEERFGVDLSEFFTSTPVTRFVTPELKAAAEQIHKEREERRSKAAKVLSSEPSGIEARDRAFIDEFSKASTLSAEQIKSVVKALREYESYAGSG